MVKTTDGSERARVTRWVTTMIIGILIIDGCAYPTPRAPRDNRPGTPLSGVFGENANTDNWLDTQVHFNTNLPDTVYDGLVPCEHRECATKLVNLKIAPENFAHTRPITPDFFKQTAPGYVLARIFNNDPRKVAFRTLSLPFRDYAYMWAGDLPGGGRGIGFFVKQNGRWVMTAKAASAYYCPRSAGTDPPTAASVHLHGEPQCTQVIYKLYPPSMGRGWSKPSLYAFASNSFHSKLAPNASVAMFGSTGLWFSCSMGCCEAHSIEALI